MEHWLDEMDAWLNSFSYLSWGGLCPPYSWLGVFDRCIQAPAIIASNGEGLGLGGLPA